MTKKYCCDKMKWTVKHNLIYRDNYGVYSIDNPEEGIDINYCPFCKHELPETFIPE